MFGDNDTAMAAAAAEPRTTQPAAVNAPIFLPGEANDGDCRRSSIARSFDFARNDQIRNLDEEMSVASSSRYSVVGIGVGILHNYGIS
jgi:hypothetical protein